MTERWAESVEESAGRTVADGTATRAGAGEASADGRSNARSVRLRDGRRVAYAEYGDPEGVPVCVLHGTPGSRLLGGLFDEPARAAGVRVLAPDRPGYGRSTPHPTRRLADTGRVVAAVLDDAGASSAGLVGFSGGGPHALAAAAARGGRVRSVDVVAGAVPPSLRSSPPPTLCLLETLARRAPSLAAKLVGGMAALARRAPPSLVVSQYIAPDGEEGDKLPDGVAELVRRDFVEAFARHRSGFVAETRLLADSWGFQPSRVASRVRLWHGTRDANVPAASARRLVERLPDAKLTTLDDADHLRTLLRCRSRVLERHASELA